MTLYMQRQSSYKVHLNTINNGELSDPLSNSVNRGLTFNSQIDLIHVQFKALLSYI